MSMPVTGISPSFEVAFVSNLLERLYKDPNHKITAAANLKALGTDSHVAQLTKTALQAPGLITDDAQKQAALATQKLYDKKTNFDLLFANLFAADKDGVDISDVRRLFGQSVDKQIFGGLTLNQVVGLRKMLTDSGDTQAQKELDFWVHGQGSHEGDLVGPDGKRIGAVSILQNVDPKTDNPVETKEEAKARSDAATAKAAPVDPLSHNLPTMQAFQAELTKENLGRIDKVFVNSEVTGHKAKGDFIHDVLVNKLGAADLASAADANLTISSNAGSFEKGYANLSRGGALVSRITGSADFRRMAIQDMFKSMRNLFSTLFN